MAQENFLWKKILTILSRGLIFAGFSLITLSSLLYIQRNSPHRLRFEGALTNTVSPTQVPDQIKNPALPIRIQVPAVRIDLPIIPSKLNGSDWETTTKGVSYLDISPVPGQEGNSILYGHNWTSLLGPLVAVRPGQIIKISYSDGTEVKFRIEATMMVRPADTHILAPSQEPLLTLYTCAGFMDSKRFVVTAKKA